MIIIERLNTERKNEEIFKLELSLNQKMLNSTTTAKRKTTRKNNQRSGTFIYFNNKYSKINRQHFN